MDGHRDLRTEIERATGIKEEYWEREQILEDT